MNLTRRNFLKLGAVSVASSYFFKPSLTWAQIPTPFADPPAFLCRRPELGLVEVDVLAQPSSAVINGGSVSLLTYGSYPGPTLRVRSGETVRLNFTNNLPEVTNLHLHGLHVSPSVDDPLAEIQPGESRLYEFTLPNFSSGTFWYHPHVHGTVAEQLYAGLLGTIIVEGPQDLMPELREAEEHLVVLKDFSFLDGAIPPFTMMDWMNGKEGDVLTVNGLVQPTLQARKGTLRLRLLNASNARYYRLALEEHPLYLIATDGGLIEKPVELSELILAPGERAEVLVQLSRQGSFKLQSLPYDRGAMMMDDMQGMGVMGGMNGMDHGGMDMGGMDMGLGDDEAMAGGMMEMGASSLETLLTIVAPGGLEPLPLPTSLSSVNELDLTRAVTKRQFVLGENMMRAEFFINNQPFNVNRVDVQAKLGTLEIWELVNNTDMDHPFHLHTYPFQIISRNGKDEPFRAWKDVVNLQKNEVVQIAVPFETFTGLTVYHCHIVEHEDRGMMGVLEVTG
jgi:FtsP/CotA-like multicopper oxidase with cupredoxin domain